MQKRSALTAALSSKPGEVSVSEGAIKNDSFSFPCLSPTAKSGIDGAEDNLDASFERLKLSEARLLAGSASQSFTLPNGSLAVRVIGF